MSNLRIGYLNYADLATLTASPIVTSAGAVTFLQSDARGDICQATGTASQDVKGTWGGTAYTVSEFSLWRLNLAYSDTIRLQLYSDAAWTTGVYDSGAVAAWASGLFDDWGWGYINRYFTPTSCKSFKATVAASAAALQCSRLFLGPYTEAPINPAEGFTLGLGSNSKQSRSEGASLRSVVKSTWRTAAFDMMVKTEAYRAAWFEIGRKCDIANSFVAAAYPGAGGTIERDTTIFGKFEQPPAQKLLANKYDFSMKILEL